MKIVKNGVFRRIAVKRADLRISFLIHDCSGRKKEVKIIGMVC